MRTKLWADENINYQTSQHWMVNDRNISFTMLVWLASLFFFLKAPHLFIKFMPAMIVVNILAGLVIAWFEIARRFNIWVVTNKRIIDEWGVLTRGYRELAIDKIHYVSYRQSLAGRMLDYGTVDIQTAASQGIITYRMMKEPRSLVSSITSTIERNKLYTSGAKTIEATTTEQPQEQGKDSQSVTAEPTVTAPGLDLDPLDMAMPGPTSNS
ncbi:MAG: PH domain-containing protein [Dissulfuribacterales bacterium]